MMNLQHFKQSEFREWSDLMSPRLLVMLDILRFHLAAPVNISAHPDAVGRRLGFGVHSDHNVDQWGEVLAVDAFVSGVHTAGDARNVVNVARSIGFTGIGVYPEWTNNEGEKQVGFHFGVRPTRKMGDPATWGFVDGEMVGVERAIKTICG